MPKIKSFEEIIAWQKARELNKKNYIIIQQDPFKKDYAFCDQLRRASVSICSNIAEGFERQSEKEFSKFLYIAKGSAGEVRSLLYLAYDLNYIKETEFKELQKDIIEINCMISGFISYINKDN